MQRSVLLAVFFMLLLSCSSKPEDIAKVEPKNVRENVFTIAILPEQNVFEQKKRYKPLSEYLSNALNMNVKIKLLDSYGSIYDEIRNKTIDGAFFGSFNYIMTKARGGIEPVARPVEPDGNSNYKGVIITRRDRKLTGDVQKWKDRSIALVHEATTAGYIFPVWYLKKNGVNNFKEHFGKVVFTGSHDTAILAVLKGQTDIGAAKDLIFEKLLSENPLVKNEIVVIANSISVPSNSLCVRSNLSSETKNSIKKVLLTMHTTPEGAEVLKALGAIKFKETEDSEFDSLRKMAADLGIDVGTYPFRHKR